MTYTKEELKEMYSLYIINPEWTNGVCYSMWIQDGDVEYPILNSNTGGFATFSSRSKYQKNGIEPTDELLDFIGYGFHEAMCFTPKSYFEFNHYKETLNLVYDNKPRQYEAWVGVLIIQQIIFSDDLMEELVPLAKHANEYSEFDVPSLQ